MQQKPQLVRWRRAFQFSHFIFRFRLPVFAHHIITVAAVTRVNMGVSFTASGTEVSPLIAEINNEASTKCGELCSGGLLLLLLLVVVAVDVGGHFDLRLLRFQ